MSQGRVPRPVEILQLGCGRVGSALVALVLEHREAIAAETGLWLRYLGVAGRDRVRWGDPPSRAALAEGWESLPALGDALARLASLGRPGSPRRVLVDTTSGATAPLLTSALASGIPVATANKIPLSGTQDDFDRIMEAAREGGSRIGYECTVGAALPVLRTIAGMRLTGDRILEVHGSLSGTLGYVMHQVSEGVALGDAVREAHRLGYTEPDPRDDLDGMDVARKALILARTMGLRREPSDVERVPLVDPGDRSLPIPEFLAAIGSAGGRIGLPSAGPGEVPRYLAEVSEVGIRVGVGLRPRASVWGSLTGSDNLVSIRSRRYDASPMVIQGTGAGPEVTAAGVLEDLVEVVR